MDIQFILDQTKLKGYHCKSVIAIFAFEITLTVPLSSFQTVVTTHPTVISLGYELGGDKVYKRGFLNN